ncbi:MAG: SprT family zinc-dependent metalloprotease [Smithellaceae bacterium]|nr:SprT family zinc-dependent metalloprotease [Smithellaceae bacterium]
MEEIIQINELVRSRRKTIALMITNDAELVVRAPLHTPLSYIKRLVLEKGDWIRKKILEVSRRAAPTVKEYLNGEEFLYLGGIYKLQIVQNADIGIALRDKLYLLERLLPNAPEVLKQWYKTQALNVISERVAWYGRTSELKPSSIKISDAKRRWGSCGSKGTLNFNWRLIMAPLAVVDYLVVHELVHLEHNNHSPAYWSRVRAILPDYRERVQWLRENGRLLRI